LFILGGGFFPIFWFFWLADLLIFFFGFTCHYTHTIFTWPQIVYMVLHLHVSKLLTTLTFIWRVIFKKKNLQVHIV
jgi:hypothetical protein